MSSYLTFFVRPKEDIFTTIGSYCRNTPLYQKFSQYLAPYGKVRGLTKPLLIDLLEEVERERADTQKEIDKIPERKQEIVAMTGATVSEKIEALNQCDVEEKELREWVEDNDRVIHSIEFMIEIIYDSSMYDHLEEHYLYCGIDIGEPCEEDIAT